MAHTQRCSLTCITCPWSRWQPLARQLSQYHQRKLPICASHHQCDCCAYANANPKSTGHPTDRPTHQPTHPQPTLPHPPLTNTPHPPHPCVPPPPPRSWCVLPHPQLEWAAVCQLGQLHCTGAVPSQLRLNSSELLHVLGLVICTVKHARLLLLCYESNHRQGGSCTHPAVMVTATPDCYMLATSHHFESPLLSCALRYAHHIGCRA